MSCAISRESPLLSLARNGRWSPILEFLCLSDVVHVLVSIDQAKHSFAPSPLHLSMVFRRLLPAYITLNDEELQETVPTLKYGRLVNNGDSVIDDNKLLTLKQLLTICKFVRNIPKECNESPASRLSGDKCILASGKDEKGWVIELAIRCSLCEDCDMIVLWECGVCSKPSGRCRAHAPMCRVCEQEVCTECMLDDDICEGCGFRCVECEETFHRSTDTPYACSIPSCPWATGPYCDGCLHVFGGPGPDIRMCRRCGRMTCMDCETTTCCDNCGDVSRTHRLHFLALL